MHFARYVNVLVVISRVQADIKLFLRVLSSNFVKRISFISLFISLIIYRISRYIIFCIACTAGNSEFQILSNESFLFHQRKYSCFFHFHVFMFSCFHVFPSIVLYFLLYIIFFGISINQSEKIVQLSNNLREIYIFP